MLLIRPSALGDVCRSVPVLASLRRALPNARIDWLVNDSFAAAIEHHPALTNLVPFARKALGEGLKRLNTRPTREFLAGLRRTNYDLVIDAQGLFRSGFFARATRAPRRVGFANARELGWAFMTERHEIDPAMHTVDRMLRLIELAGIPPIADMRLYSCPPEREAMSRLVGNAPWPIVLAPTSRWPGKQWPSDRFAALARHLVSRGQRVALVGAPAEREQCAQLIAMAEADPRVLDLIGKTGIAGLMALIEQSPLVIANDSAPLHIAVGFKRPLVALFGPTRRQTVGPYKRDADVIQHAQPGDSMDHKNEASGRALMARISTSEVIEAAETRLATSS
ncbi:MAG: glycosyltransferase family 9 protein [Phycisphaerae bacterium]|nr:glycosyltransferase family 9 protein [Phycisphaerae bacterium]